VRTADRLRNWVPRWWRGEAGAGGELFSLLLTPAEAAFRGGVLVRNGLYGREILGVEKADIPVISVGNISVGGTGKTPVTAWLVARLRSWGRRPAVVTRGYGADEVALHRELNPSVPVLVAPRRASGVAEAARGGSDCAVLDDGFQHRALFRDLDLVLIAAERWQAPHRLLPRGPWREPPTALRRADYVLVIRKSATLEAAAALARQLVESGLTVEAGVAHIAAAHLLHVIPSEGVVAAPLTALDGRSVLVATSIADPTPLVTELERLGAEVELLAYPDHYAFTPDDVDHITRRAGERPVVMTRKDSVKLVEVGQPANLYVLEQDVRIEQGGDALDARIRQVLKAGR
jgi:tetraacyldisaccharide 4'-kinase